MQEDAPPVLALLGDPAALAPRAVALVGARNASAAGRRIAEDLAEALAAEGLAVVSGLARGIDAAAHLGALRRGRTIACVAGGLDQPYPPENAGLQARIAAEGGAVLAEAPLGTAPLARHFPRRNRIVAALSLGVVVIEAAPALRQPDHRPHGAGGRAGALRRPRQPARPPRPRLQRPDPPGRASGRNRPRTCCCTCPKRPARHRCSPRRRHGPGPNRPGHSFRASSDDSEIPPKSLICLGALR